MMWSTDIAGAVATLAYVNPPENRIPFDSLIELSACLRAIAKDDGIKLVVLRSGVSGYFSLGASLADVQALANGQEPSAPFHSWVDVLLQLEHLPQPTIAMIEGQAASGGCELALACMFRVGTRAASFAFREVARGAMPGAGATQRLPRLVGTAHAAKIILTSCLVDATEAHRIGLLDAVLPDGEAALEQWFDAIRAMPRAGLVAAKRAIVEGSTLPLRDGLRLEQRLFLDLVRRSSEPGQKVERLHQ
ncbi:enoyl-CoA hydratase/isomerase family protein [Rhizorhabdus dicambivorans]|uniref:Enoyl-CoA hydratase/isomerase family protein n=1 Tax=Rhizorhabdus dicambivorans TaxID=1850238 RepID=A0A2A4FYL1_9SPHN|nr:enoyl-CoA hydratase/isomerase family protein [Rhizorhabdus dicambivorans]ATE64135.1 enoyl-CoA hydratase/isomerase family protein [Rhizorhabdus dicambivorans]PCE42594.1 enoyl-CoA hydratase/isomerase family protein [Rhizorhabdus dicambivorans]